MKVNAKILNLRYLFYRLKAYLLEKSLDLVSIKGICLLRNVTFEGKNVVKNVNLSRVKVGLGTYISGDSNLKDINIGRFCSIGKNVSNGFSLHPTSKFVSTHPAFFSLKEQAGFTFVKTQKFNETKYYRNKTRIIIENDVWIGNNVVLMDGIKIGNGAIIAAGAIVTKDVEPYAIVGGVPAKLIKYRFDQRTVSSLQKLEWWNWSLEKLQSISQDFENIENFITKYDEVH